MNPDFRRTTILYGGSFDPVHEGHLHVSSECAKAVPEAQVIFVPAFESPGRKAVAPPALRLAMLKAVGVPTWDFEVQRVGASYTVETLEAAHHFGAEVDRLYWLLGADAYAGFARWKNPARIRELCRLLIVDRPGQESASQHPLDRFVSIPPHPASSTAIRAALAAGDAHPAWLPGPVQKLLLRENPYVTKKG